MVNSEGVVGQVFAITPNYAKVLLAIAPSSAIDVLLQKSRVRGILKGDGKHSPTSLRVYFENHGS